jgi:hypothetical protein
MNLKGAKAARPYDTGIVPAAHRLGDRINRVIVAVHSLLALSDIATLANVGFAPEAATDQYVT